MSDEVALPDFDAFFMSFGRCLKYLGLNELHLAVNTRSTAFQWLQRGLYCLSWMTVGYACLAEFFYLLFYFKEKPFELSDFRFVSELVGCWVFTVLALLKITFLPYKRREIIEMMGTLRRLHNDVVDAPEKRLALAVIAPANIIFTMYLYFTMVTVVMYSMFRTVLNVVDYAHHLDVVWDTPYTFWYPWDEHANALIFAVSYTTNFLAGINVGFISGVYNIFFAYVMTNEAMHFDVLCHKLLQVGVHEEDVGYEKREAVDMQRIRTAVELHTTLLKLCDISEDIFGVPLLVNMMSFSFLICTLFFGITIAEVQYVIKYVTFLCSCILQLFITSYYGNKLQTSSGSIAQAAYESNWPEASPKIKKSVLILIGNGFMEKSFSVMGFTKISMTTMTGILKVSFSYYTLLRTVYDKKLNN